MSDRRFVINAETQAETRLVAELNRRFGHEIAAQRERDAAVRRLIRATADLGRLK